jgi:hypothetical protein
LASQAEPTELFGREHSQQLAGLLGAIEQTFGGVPLYPSLQSRAAHLLYFVIKDHPFADGNKRIGALLFLEYLRRNDSLIRPGGMPLFEPNTIVALALLIAESEPRHKNDDPTGPRHARRAITDGQTHQVQAPSRSRDNVRLARLA